MALNPTRVAETSAAIGAALGMGGTAWREFVRAFPSAAEALASIVDVAHRLESVADFDSVHDWWLTTDAVVAAMLSARRAPNDLELRHCLVEL